MSLEQWLSVLVAAGLLTAAVLGWRRSRLRAARVRRRRRRVLDELDEVGVEQVHGVRELSQGGAAAATGEADSQVGSALGAAEVLQGRGGLVRKGESFYVVPESPGRWPRSGDVRLRFERGGVRHELRCRVVGRGRRRGGRRVILVRLCPLGVLVKQERRDMMRFYVGSDGGSPRGTVDARRYIDLRARLRRTDLVLDDDAPLPRHVVLDLPTVDQEGAGADGVTATPEQDGVDVEVIDFSASGLRVEAALPALAPWLAVDGRDVLAVLEDLAEQILLVTVEVHLQFPPRVRELEPEVPRRTWMLVEVARVSMLTEAEGGDACVRLGLALLYQTIEVDAATGAPQRWERIPERGEADAFVAIHTAINQALALLHRDAPVDRTGGTPT